VVFVKSNHVGHMLLVKVSRRVGEEVISKSIIIKEKQKIEGRYAGAGVSTHPIFALLEDTPVY
jgi:hypothetical protein